MRKEQLYSVSCVKRMLVYYMWAMSRLLRFPVPSGKTHALNPYLSATAGKSVYLQDEVSKGQLFLS